MRLDHLLSERKARAAGVRRGPDASPDLKLRACVSERWCFISTHYFLSESGDLAQLARASALQAEGQGFKSPNLHSQIKLIKKLVLGEPSYLKLQEKGRK